jgi:two-component system nitrogen regulation response regulator GlnG
MSKRLISVFAASSPDLPPPGLYDRVLAEVERPLIRHALKATKGNQIRAAAVLASTETPYARRFRRWDWRLGAAIDATVIWRQHMLL